MNYHKDMHVSQAPGVAERAHAIIKKFFVDHGEFVQECHTRQRRVHTLHIPIFDNGPAVYHLTHVPEQKFECLTITPPDLPLVAAHGIEYLKRETRARIEEMERLKKRIETLEKQRQDLIRFFFKCQNHPLGYIP